MYLRFISCTLIISTICVSCGNDSNNSKSSADSANKVNDSTIKTNDSLVRKGDSSVSSRPIAPLDKITTNFAVAAAGGGLMEVQLGKMAQEKSSNDRVRNFGMMMVRDHTKANDDLKATATTQGIALPTVPSEKEQEMMQKLSKKIGFDFDKAYMSMMVDDHKEDIDEFRKAADNCPNEPVRAFATQILPTLQIHLDSAKTIEASLKK